MSDPTTKPTHYVFLVSAPTREGGKKVWTRLAPLWVTNGDPDKAGFDVPEGMAISGRLVILKADEKTGEVPTNPDNTPF